MKFGTVSPGRYTGADRYTGVAVARRSTVYDFLDARFVILLAIDLLLLLVNI